MKQEKKKVSRFNFRKIFPKIENLPKNFSSFEHKIFNFDLLLLFKNTPFNDPKMQTNKHTANAQIQNIESHKHRNEWISEKNWWRNDCCFQNVFFIVDFIIDDDCTWKCFLRDVFGLFEFFIIHPTMMMMVSNENFCCWKKRNKKNFK